MGDRMEKIKSYLLIILGNALLALGISAFVIPHHFISTGVTGISLFFNHFFNTNLELGVTIINVVALIIGFLILGKRFALTSIASTFLFPFFLDFFNQSSFIVNATQDHLLAAILAGVLSGFGIGLMMKEGSSTGGLDIPPLVFHKYFHWNIAVSVYVIDTIVLISQFFYSTTQDILYGFVVLVVTTFVLDQTLMIGSSSCQVLIVSPLFNEINEAIHNEIDRGTTYLKIKTGFLNHDQQMVMSIVQSRELKQVERIVHEIDPTAFMVVSKVKEVKGRGFGLDKSYLKKYAEEIEHD